MKKPFSFVLSLVMVFSITVPAFAVDETATVAYRDEANKISSEAVEKVLQRHASSANMMDGIQEVQIDEEAVSALFSERSFAVMSGDMDEVARIDRELENYGYYDLTDEDMELLFPQTYIYGPPTKPGNTRFVTFKINSGTTSGGYKYTNITAVSNYAPNDGKYEADSLPLYNCKELNIYPSKTNYTSTFLKKALQIGASEAIGATTKTIPGILLSEFANIAIEDFFKTGQPFGASSYAVTAQTMVFSYLADVPDYYTHYVTAEQCNMLVIYYFAYTSATGPDGAMAKSKASFSSANFTNPQNKAQSNIKNQNYIRDEYYCGTIKLTYPTMEGSNKSVTLSRQYYSELYSIPGI